MEDWISRFPLAANVLFWAIIYLTRLCTCSFPSIPCSKGWKWTSVPQHLVETFCRWLVPSAQKAQMLPSTAQAPTWALMRPWDKTTDLPTTVLRGQSQNHISFILSASLLSSFSPKSPQTEDWVCFVTNPPETRIWCFSTWSFRYHLDLLSKPGYRLSWRYTAVASCIEVGIDPGLNPDSAACCVSLGTSPSEHPTPCLQVIKTKSHRKFIWVTYSEPCLVHGKWQYKAPIILW